MKRPVAASVPEYIASFPPRQRTLMKQLRSLIRKTAPQADEVISYGIAGYKYNGMLVYFAGYEHHVGFYAGKAPLEVFKKELAKFKTGKGSVQFPLDQDLPLPLLRKMIEFRVEQNESKAKSRPRPRVQAKKGQGKA